MAAIVGGALLAAAMEMLVKKIVSREYVALLWRTERDDELLEKLKITLLSLQSVLHDAEDKQITNPAIKEWLNRLQDAVFQVDDLFDEINTEALRRQVEAGQVLKKLSSPFERFSKKINYKLTKLFKTLEHLRDQNLGLRGDSNCVWNVTPTSSVLGDESAIYGRDDDRKKLKEFLLSEDGCDSGNKIGVISIWGMGGLGKTTLAKLLYNDPDVKEKFKVRGWTHIPKGFDVVNVTKTLLESVTPKTDTTNELNIPLIQLQKTLSNKKFLLVLDDMSHEKYVDWNSLVDIFNVGQIGSKIIIITSRNEKIALPTLKSLCDHNLSSLKTEDSWSLLARHAFVEINYQQHPNLEEIGREIAKKCGGLPLAAIALGGILRRMLPDRWSDVLNSSIWERISDDVQSSLLLSYRYLPPSLKGCFAYCSIFPKNSILRKKMVVQLWIAEGLIPQPKNENSWEKVAEEFFDELVSRSLICQRSIDDDSEQFIGDEEVCFEMHDLINDLAMAVSSSYCTLLDINKPNPRVRYLAYDRFEYNSDGKFEKLHGLKGLRTFLPMPLQILWHYDNSVSSKLFSDLLSTMTQLHVLSLSDYINITKLPNSIGKLIYLRYLNLSGTSIARLPSETCKLCNLQTMLLSRCEELTELPKDMGKLVKLRHLDIRGTPLKKMPVQISKLENLQTLSDFIVSSVKDVGLKIEDLGKYPHLSGSLSISQLENVTDPFRASQAKLEMKKEIEKLELGWSYTAPSNSEIQSEVLERLRPSTNLKSLTISGYSGDKLPNWMGESLMIYLNSLQKLTLKNILFLSSFQGDILPKTLQSLKIEGCDSITSFTLCSLPVLKSITIERCKRLKFITIEDESKQNLLFLRTIEIQSCDELEWVFLSGLPIPNLTELTVWNCEKFLFLPESIKTLTSLKKMSMIGLPNLQTFSLDDLPITLRELSIGVVGGIWWNTTWEHLTSLSELFIWGSDMLKTPMKRQVQFLPTNLTLLCIADLEDIECLDGKWLQHLTSLHTLEISNAPSLKSLPEKWELPSSLKNLSIRSCPLLEANLWMKQGKEWLKISHIPKIYINFEIIT